MFHFASFEVFLQQCSWDKMPRRGGNWIPTFRKTTPLSRSSSVSPFLGPLNSKRLDISKQQDSIAQ